MAVTGVKAVVVRQKESGAILSVAEIKIFVGDEEVSSSADCFSFPTEGYWGTMDKITGAEWRLNDGDLSTYSHAGNWNAAVQNYGTQACSHALAARMQAPTHPHRQTHRQNTHRHARTHALAHTHIHAHIRTRTLTSSERSTPNLVLTG